MKYVINLTIVLSLIVFLIVITTSLAPYLGGGEVPIIYINNEIVEEKEEVLTKNKKELQDFNNFLQKNIKKDNNIIFDKETMSFYYKYNDEEYEEKKLGYEKIENIKKILKKLIVDEINLNSDSIEYMSYSYPDFNDFQTLIYLFTSDEKDYNKGEIGPVFQIVREKINNRIFILEECNRNNCIGCDNGKCEVMDKNKSSELIDDNSYLLIFILFLVYCIIDIFVDKKKSEKNLSILFLSIGGVIFFYNVIESMISLQIGKIDFINSIIVLFFMLITTAVFYFKYKSDKKMLYICIYILLMYGFFIFLGVI